MGLGKERDKPIKKKRKKKKGITESPRESMYPLDFEVHATPESFRAGTGTTAIKSHVTCSRIEQPQAICVGSEALLHPRPKSEAD